ncbi:3618_t:CDS:2 [Ambispora gerdemannii]|uniref:3618_t:CDS:1 n=1 Tax=Ambispora gerdemannii TaxID=144530 RepID=A0A9N8VT34_9GLOM|nr:3618_t:CDS:2 [Ambispora gerdemannii]
MNNNEYLTETERQLLNEPPYDLTLEIEELTKPSKKNRNNSDKLPRPQNSWIIFRRDYQASLRCRSPNVRQEVKLSLLNDTLSTIEYNHTIITASTIIDDIHPSTINTNNDAGNSANNAYNEITSLDQFLLSGNIDINVNNADSAAIGHKHLSTINASNDIGNSFNNAFNEIIPLELFPFLSGSFDINVNNHEDSTAFDYIHPSINNDTNNDVRNSINDMFNEITIISLEQFPFLSGNVDI